MTRRMSCAWTVPQVEDRTKTVTRRHVDTWQGLKPGDRLTLIEKGQGLKKGEHQRVLAEVEVINVRIEPLSLIAEPGELVSEGFAGWEAWRFIVGWCRSHGYRGMVPARVVAPSLTMRQIIERVPVRCRRIEWRYL